VSGIGDLTLMWEHAPQHTRYEVWASASPYFDPGVEGTLIETVVPPATGVTASFTDDPVGDSRYYMIVAVNIAGQRSLPSNPAGLFRFPLTPGDLG
jgi:hypothetical protein